MTAHDSIYQSLPASNEEERYPFGADYNRFDFYEDAETWEEIGGGRTKDLGTLRSYYFLLVL